MAEIATHGTLPTTLGKVEAVAALATRAGLPGGKPESEHVANDIAAFGAALGRLSNAHVELGDAATTEGAHIRPVLAANSRVLSAPRHKNGMHKCFTDASAQAHSPDLNILELSDGSFCHYVDIPLVIPTGGDVIVRDYSSRYAGLVHFYAAPLRQVLADAQRIDGTVVVLGDDVRPLNYCHWIVDWLPRLAFLGEQVLRDDLFVAVPTLRNSYPWETLRLAGIAPERVIQLGPMHAVRARRLLVTSDITKVPHPGHKAAPWVLDYLRATLGFGVFIGGIEGKPFRRKIYVSRDDAEGRRVTNEAALLAALSPLGYERVQLGALPFAEQAATFACASHIVAPHGAGLVNIVFGARDATLVEIFPQTYGTPAYYVLAAGLGMTYASYIATDITEGDRPQTDDLTVDIPDFLARCRHLL